MVGFFDFFKMKPPFKVLSINRRSNSNSLYVIYMIVGQKKRYVLDIFNESDLF